MPPSSRNQSSRTEYADSKGFGYETHNDYPNEYRHRERYRSHTQHAPRAGHREYHPHVSSENRQHRNNSLSGSRITVTSYRIPTQGEFMNASSYHEATISYHQSTTSYHHTPLTSYHHTPLTSYHHTPSTSYHHIPSTSYTVSDSHRSSSGYREFLSDLNDEDERNFSDRAKHHKSRSNDRRKEDAKGNRTDRHHRHRDQRPDHEKPKEPKATYTDNHRYATNNTPGQGKRESSKSQRPGKPHSSKSENCREENPGSKRSDRFHEDHGKNSRQEIPQSRVKEELPDLYGILGIGPLATEEEIKSAAKRRRIEFHPDKLKRPGMSTSELAKIDDAAAQVGMAADILQNPKQKLEYDRKSKASSH